MPGLNLFDHGDHRLVDRYRHTAFRGPFTNVTVEKINRRWATPLQRLQTGGTSPAIFETNDANNHMAPELLDAAIARKKLAVIQLAAGGRLPPNTHGIGHRRPSYL